VPLLEEAGPRGLRQVPDRKFVEMVELPDHPWFLGCQFHPEFKSKPTAPHPLFVSFIAAAVAEHRRREESASGSRAGGGVAVPRERSPRVALAPGVASAAARRCR
jgi:CTP synthase